MEKKVIFTVSVILITVASFFFAFILIKDQILLVDEGNHYDQIMRFVRGEYQFNQILMTIPGYHLLLASIVRMVPTKDLPTVRFISFLINLLVIPLFYAIARRIDQRSALLKTFQFSFFPIIFPYYFLIYTDILSLILVLGAFFFVLKKNYTAAGIIGSASLFVRQNNVIWLLLFNLWLYLTCSSSRFNRSSILLHIKRSVFFIIGIVSLAFFFMYSGGVVVSGYAKNYVHLSWSLTGNIYFFLFVSFVLLLPRQISVLPRIVSLCKRKKWILGALIILYLFVMTTFANDNPFNHATWFIHNSLLEYFSRNIFTKSVFNLFIAYTLLAFGVTQLRYRWAYLIYPFSLIYLLPYWLIEQRYYIIPLVLFILLSKRGSLKIEYAQLGINILLSVIIFAGIVSLKFFL